MKKATIADTTADFTMAGKQTKEYDGSNVPLSILRASLHLNGQEELDLRIRAEAMQSASRDGSDSRVRGVGAALQMALI